MRRAHELRRRRATRDVKVIFTVFCEGRVTEAGYAGALRSTFRGTPIRIEVADVHGDPKFLVEHAAAWLAEAKRMGRRSGDPVDLDQVWCVFDVDDHARLPEAKDQAAANGIRLAVSNPCFELWALLHYQDQSAYLHRDAVRAAFIVHQPGYDKALDCADLINRFAGARARAISLRDWHRSLGEDETSNPSSNVWELVDAIASAAKQPLSPRRPLRASRRPRS